MKKIVDIFDAALNLDGWKALSHLEVFITDLFWPKADNACMCCCCYNGCC